MPEEGTQTGTPEGGAGAAAGSGSAAANTTTFTQEDVDRIVGQRLAKETSKFSDYEDLKARAARADELETASQTETDKLRTKAEREAEKRAESEKKAAEATERANNALKRSAVVAAAAQLNAADPGDVFTLLDKEKLSIDDDGNVTGAPEAVAELLKAKPHLLKRAAGSGFDGGAQGGSSTQQPDMNARIREAAGFGPSR